MAVNRSSVCYLLASIVGGLFVVNACAADDPGRAIAPAIGPQPPGRNASSVHSSDAGHRTHQSQTVPPAYARNSSQDMIESEELKNQELLMAYFKRNVLDHLLAGYKPPSRSPARDGYLYVSIEDIVPGALRITVIPSKDSEFDEAARNAIASVPSLSEHLPLRVKAIYGSLRFGSKITLLREHLSYSRYPVPNPNVDLVAERRHGYLADFTRRVARAVRLRDGVGPREIRVSLKIARDGHVSELKAIRWSETPGLTEMLIEDLELAFRMFIPKPLPAELPDSLDMEFDYGGLRLKTIPLMERYERERGFR